jgi:hypothetical protein
LDLEKELEIKYWSPPSSLCFWIFLVLLHSLAICLLLYLLLTPYLWILKCPRAWSFSTQIFSLYWVMLSIGKTSNITYYTDLMPNSNFSWPTDLSFNSDSSTSPSRSSLVWLIGISNITNLNQLFYYPLQICFFPSLPHITREQLHSSKVIHQKLPLFSYTASSPLKILMLLPITLSRMSLLPNILSHYHPNLSHYL